MNLHFKKRHNLQPKKETVLLCKAAACNMTFEDRDALDRHMATHPKPFFCKWPNCDYVSRTRTKVYEHFVTEHIDWPDDDDEEFEVPDEAPMPYIGVHEELLKWGKFDPDFWHIRDFEQ